MFGRKTKQWAQGHVVEGSTTRERRHAAELRLLQTRIAALEATVSDLHGVETGEVAMISTRGQFPAAFAEAWEHGDNDDDSSAPFFDIEIEEGPARRWFLAEA